MIWILLMESPAGSTRSVTGVEQDLLACRLLVDIQEPLLAAVKRGWNLHGLGMSPVFRASWRLDDAVVSRGNVGWTMSKSGHPCPCQNCSCLPSTGRAGRGSLLNHPSSSPMTQSVKGLNWTEWKKQVKQVRVKAEYIKIRDLLAAS